jgi:queuine tRNA-ribosyltransferase
VALVADSGARWRVDLVKPGQRDSKLPIEEGCPCPACTGGFTRAYLHYLLRARELTGMRLVTMHNLSFIGRLMGELREAIEAGRLAEVASALMAGMPV